jgi:hypothetical protein
LDVGHDVAERFKIQDEEEDVESDVAEDVWMIAERFKTRR